VIRSSPSVFPAALAGAATVVITGLMAMRLGGGRFAQALAALSIALSPVVLGNGARYFSMNAFDLLFGHRARFVFLRILQGRPIKALAPLRRHRRSGSDEQVLDGLLR
jgi:dolichyl-phosphate-mannose--protein O-mannosyl transferase